ncbi:MULTISPECIES: ABC transporter substrate-binding protein [unclassified Burkholderia]|uniref:urea ABC transporter substrate-binding protein n=1 Tax=unclassified Burkholderia TaxID=2613784 RepID=UPI000F583F3E|nr:MULTISPECIES: ABC transporter substrate-binding protein [unclassified Burkholderia]RQR76536.1 urea ABC transporter [Burkholderia sp. Bp9011]RQR87290.1 urea ABC transporter [Burkholderia sp. Bp9010]RQS69699.1 urea ABC transporter [Burkholderia sp. Bp8977]
MSNNRRDFIKSIAALSGAVLAESIPFSAFAGSESVTIASLHDISGAFNAYSVGANLCMQFAAKELNAAGGLLGKQVVVKVYDAQSDINKYPQYAQQAALRDRVVMAMGALTGAAREATRPILRKYKVPYFYGSVYEGGVCEQNTFCVNTEGNQQIVPLLEWSFKNLGKKLYYIASDYNAPRTFGAWNHVMAKRQGGSVVADDYYPLDTTDFTSAIAKIQAAKPDFIHSCLVGGPAMAFYRQWAAAGMLKKIPIVSMIFGAGLEHEVLSPQETNGIYAAYNYFQELDTPQNKDFLSRFRKAMGKDHPYLSGEAIGGYNGVMLWAECVKCAKSFDRDAVMKAWESGISWEGPGGKMVTDGPTHHTTQDVHIIRVQDRVWSLVETRKQIRPDRYGGRCDVPKYPAQTDFLQPQL